MSKKIVFIVNPKAGTGRKKSVTEMINKEFSSYLNYEIMLWEKSFGDISHMADKAIQSGAHIVVAVGGDGTVNAVAKALVGTHAALAIIPIGSGNGLARHLQIPLDAIKSLGLIHSGREYLIDSCSVNDKSFFCTAGIGFDAHNGKMFAESKKRGFFSYIKITLSQFISYHPEEYHLLLDNKEVKQKAFLVTFANAGQYGNNVFIAPHADIGDGVIDVCILRPFHIWNVVGIALRLFNKTISQSRFYERYQGKNIVVQRANAAPVHYDGEPAEMPAMVTVKITPHSLRVIVPR